MANFFYNLEFQKLVYRDVQMDTTLMLFPIIFVINVHQVVQHVKILLYQVVKHARMDILN